MRQTLQYILRLLSILVLAKYRPKIVAITGSVGKSSAKEAAYLVLETKFPSRVWRNKANLNTEIGVPLTILGGEDAQRSVIGWLANFFKAFKLVFFKDKNYPEFLILEMAADKPNDIAYLTSFINPDVAVVTAIGEMPVHLEFFPEREAYINEKANVLKSLKPQGTAILNYDDLSVRELRDMVPTDRARIYYGFENGAEIEITNFSYNVPAKAEEIEKSGMDFSVEDKISKDLVDFKISKTLGLPALYSALAGMAVGKSFGISLKDSAKALEKFILPDHRLKLLKGIKDTIIIDDSYNSSPLACQAALEVLSKFKKNRKIAVLGSMRELGANTESAHRLIGRQAAKTADVLFLIGPEMVSAKEEAKKLDLKLDKDIFWFSACEEAKNKVAQILQPDDVVLIKGSRSVKMETVVEEVRVK